MVKWGALAKPSTRQRQPDLFQQHPFLFKRKVSLSSRKTGPMDVSEPLSEPLQHVYASLPTERFIRLIESIRYEQEKSRLLCSMYMVDLDSQPEFEALSYTWAPPIRDMFEADYAEKDEDGEKAKEDETDEDEYYIQCDGENLKIGQNLYDFLFEVACTGTTLPLWADAICINQSNSIERQQQVLLMGDIYSSAKRVFCLAWNELR